MRRLAPKAVSSESFLPRRSFTVPWAMPGLSHNTCLLQSEREVQDLVSVPVSGRCSLSQVILETFFSCSHVSNLPLIGVNCNQQGCLQPGVAVPRPLNSGNLPFPELQIRCEHVFARVSSSLTHYPLNTSSLQQQLGIVQYRHGGCTM